MFEKYDNHLKGLVEELEKMGAVQGDKVRILDFEFEYRN